MSDWLREGVKKDSEMRGEAGAEGDKDRLPLCKNRGRQFKLSLEPHHDGPHEIAFFKVLLGSILVFIMGIGTTLHNRKIR